MTYQFPRTRFVDINTSMMQLNHIDSEASEIVRALIDDDYAHAAMEVVDLIHSAETLLRILEEKHGVRVDKLDQIVISKNRERGHYE